MNLKKLLIFMLVGIVCSVSAVSAADINDTAVEIESHDATMGVDGLSDDPITIQKMDNGVGKVMTPEELDNLNSANEKVIKKNNVDTGDYGILDCNYNPDHGLHFNLTTFPQEDTHKVSNINFDNVGKLLTTAIKYLGNKIAQETLNVINQIGYPTHESEKHAGSSIFNIDSADDTLTGINVDTLTTAIKYVGSHIGQETLTLTKEIKNVFEVLSKYI